MIKFSGAKNILKTKTQKLENSFIKISSLKCFKNSLFLCDLSKYVN